MVPLKNLRQNPARKFALIAWLSIAHSLPAIACAQPASTWVGKRVVQKFNELTLRDGTTVGTPAGNVPFYRVETEQGAWLFLKAEKGPVEGWASSDDVIAVDDAVDFFTKRARKQPRDPFNYAAPDACGRPGPSLTSH